MLALDNLIAPRERAFLPARLTLALALSAFALGVMSFAVRGFSENGLRLGVQLIWRFGGLVLFAALVAGPAGRLIPPLSTLADKGRPLLQGFCAIMGVYLAFLLLPNLFIPPDGTQARGLSAGMTLFVLFTGGVTLVMAAALSRRLRPRLGEQASRTLLGLSAIFFWLCHGLIGLAHVSGPQQHDAYYEFSILLMIVALLARVTDRVLATRRPDTV